MRVVRCLVRPFSLAAVAALLVACAASGTPAAPPAAPTAPPPSGSGAAPPAASPVAKVPPLSPPVTVRIGRLPTVSDAGMHLGTERGYFLEEGIDIQAIPFDSAAQMVAPLGAGQLEVGGGSTSAGLYNAIARDVPLKIVADKGSMPPGAGWLALVVRRDLADQIRDYADLRGRRIAINQFGTTNDIALEAALKRGGLTLQDVEVVQLPFADMNPALANRSIDVAQHNEPFMATAIEQGLAVRFRGVDEYYPYMQFSVILYGPHFVRDQPEAARRWMVAYLRGVRDYNDAFLKGIGKEEVVRDLMKYVPLRDPTLFDKMIPVGLDPDGKVNVEGLRNDLRWFVEHGLVTQPPDLDRVVDTSFAEYAVSRLGPYPR
ncbi:MAG TPA: ABC transporter substrate-binding protein [Chloroflexota bacterium]|nr:ABC transporter substrate-binding protein [Chloroflexota bacterium]